MIRKSIAKIPLRIAREITPEHLRKRLQSSEGRIADFITNLSGSMIFIYLHIIAFTLFFTYRPFELAIFNILLSLEAVFLATFILVAQKSSRDPNKPKKILVAQKRQALIEEYRELEEEQEQEEEEREKEELEEDVEDIQKDLDDIKSAMNFIQEKISAIEKSPISQNANGGK